MCHLPTGTFEPEGASHPVDLDCKVLGTGIETGCWPAPERSSLGYRYRLKMARCTRGWLIRGATLGAVVVLTGTALTVVAPPASGAVGSWRVSASLPPLAADLDAVACVSALRCVAVGAGLPPGFFNPTGPSSMMTTFDGGSTWVRDEVPAGDQLYGIACSTVESCVVVGSDPTGDGVIASTSSGGAAWTVDARASRPLNGISCSGSTCVAVGGSPDQTGAATVEVSSDRGIRWATAPIPSGVSQLNGVSCATALACVAVGGNQLHDVALSSADGGRRWLAGHVPETRNFPMLSAVSCWSSRACLAVGQTENRVLVLRTTSAGADWLRVMNPSGHGGQLQSVSCLSYGRCVIGGSEIGITQANILGSSIAYYDSGTNRVTVQGFARGADQFESLGVACPSQRGCLAVGDQVLEASVLVSSRLFGGWTLGVAAYGADDFSSISCPTSLDCTAVSGGPTYGLIASTRNGGASWSERYEDLDLWSISCPTADRCLAIGGNSSGFVTLTTTDGGRVWAQAPLSTPLEGGIVSCSSAEACTLVSPAWTGGGGFLAYFTDDFGQEWLEAEARVDFSGLAMSCNPSELCVAAGDHFAASTDGGATWSEADGGQSVPYVNGVACPDTTECLAVGGVVGGTPGFAEVSDDGGQTWTSLGIPPATPALAAIACPSVSMCVAGGQPSSGGAAIIETDDGGATWTPEATPDGATVSAVACPTTNWCVATAGPDILVGT